jgi:YHS domain-containing protein
MFAGMRRTARVAVLTTGVTAICGATLFPVSAQTTPIGKIMPGSNGPGNARKAKPKVQAIPNPASPYYQGQNGSGAAAAVAQPGYQEAVPQLQPVTTQPALTPVEQAVPLQATLPPTTVDSNGIDLAQQQQQQQAVPEAGGVPGAPPSVQQQLEEMYRRDGREMPQRDYQALGFDPPRPVYADQGGAATGAPRRPSFLQRWVPGLGKFLPQGRAPKEPEQPPTQPGKPGQNAGAGTPPQYAKQPPAGSRPPQPLPSPYGQAPASLRPSQYPPGHPLANQPQTRPGMPGQGAPGQGVPGQGPLVRPGQAVPPARPQNLATSPAQQPGQTAPQRLPQIPVLDVARPNSQPTPSATNAAPALLPPVAPDLAQTPASTPAPATGLDNLLAGEAEADNGFTDSVLLPDEKKPGEASAPATIAAEPATIAADPVDGNPVAASPGETPGASPEAGANSAAAPTTDTASPSADVATADENGVEVTPESLVAPLVKQSPYSGKAFDSNPIAVASNLMPDEDDEADDELLFDEPTGTARQIPVAGAPAPTAPPAAVVAETPATPSVASTPQAPAIPVDPTEAKPPVDVDPTSPEPAKLAEKTLSTGFKGYCPVTLRNERRLVEGKPEFAVELGGATYRFANADALAEFQIHPEKYVPAQGGRDVVLAGGGEPKEGSLDHAVWFRGKLYLFSTAESRQAFVAAPAKFAIP